MAPHCGGSRELLLCVVSLASIVCGHSIRAAVRHSLVNGADQVPKDAANAADWWDHKADERMQHTSTAYVMEKASDWKAFLPRVNWAGKRVLDYGIGGGYLGEVVLRNYSVASYTGVDISNRALDAASKTLQPWSNKVSFHLTPVRFQPLRPDIFVCQQVIQHFPSVPYFEEFLENVNSCGANELMLHFRQSKDGTTYSNDAYGQDKGTTRNVMFALLTSKEFIVERLTNYELKWTDSRPMCCNTYGVYTGWKRKALAAPQ
uniref:Methyltransferase type 12 domain-containing protein n=1 Tax=Alexandrium andersonii TaxID=327968 RepID=A0A7S2DC10_9DINO